MFTEPEFNTISFPVEVDQTVQKGQGVTIKLSADLPRVDLNLLSEIANSCILDLTLKSRQTEMIKYDKDNPDQIDMFDTDAEMTDEEKVQRAKEAIADGND